MTLAEQLAAIERTLDERVEVWINIIEMDLTVSKRIYRGSFQRPRDSRTAGSEIPIRTEPHHKGETLCNAPGVPDPRRTNG